MNSAVGRSCDACTACCFTHAVAGVKPGVAWCPIATLARAAASISIVPHNAATAHVAGSRVSGATRRSSGSSRGWRIRYRRTRGRPPHLVLFIETDPGAIDQRSGGEPTRVSVCLVMGEPKEIQSLTSPANAGEGADLRAASAPGRRLASRLYSIGADDLLR